MCCEFCLHNIFTSIGLTDDFYTNISVNIFAYLCISEHSVHISYFEREKIRTRAITPVELSLILKGDYAFIGHFFLETLETLGYKKGENDCQMYLYFEIKKYYFY